MGELKKMTDTPQKQEDPAAIRSFSHLMGTLEDGRLNADVTSMLKQLVKDMREAAINSGGKAKGALSLKINVALEGRTFEFTGEAKTTAPKRAASKTIMWAAPDGSLTGMNPDQAQLPFRDVNSAAPRADLDD